MKRLILAFVLIIILIFIVFWIIAIAKCEIYTKEYGDQFNNLDSLYTMAAPSDYHKVIDYTQTKATVYYINRGVGGVVLYLGRESDNSEWQLISWDCVWSATGSAEDYIWPYLWH